MDKPTIKKLIQLRYLVAYLGEKSQYSWWSSNFLNSSTKKMLEFTFPRTANLAQYEAVSAAAARIHDESIGLGKSFHLFRLPEFIEKTLVNELKRDKSDEYDSLVTSQENALKMLRELSSSASLKGEGPINVGQVKSNQWQQSISSIASAYLQAFNENKKAFPYFQGDI